ncbi:unnamed protein product [Mytilus edulis]|uniref:Uncharacterized protein n=1 Tax=Mytilus edulis TaxID=6550 RepID=A0A8S3QW96_MYTED|nr:unnamed protein product [Mytilus edulis]
MDIGNVQRRRQPNKEQKQNPCITTLQINDTIRSVTYNKTSDLCDSSLLEGWYKITSTTGELMPTSCPKMGFTCGTISPIWLSSGLTENGERQNLACAVNNQPLANELLLVFKKSNSDRRLLTYNYFRLYFVDKHFPISIRMLSDDINDPTQDIV